MNLYHDRARNLLVYPHNARIEQYVPEAKRVNGAYLAVPNTLRNVQLLRILDMPVPGIMEASGYDWPIEKGRKPLEHQKLMAEFMVSHPRCFNLSDMGCVGGETLIDTAQGAIAIEELARKGQRVKVRCLTDTGPRYVKIAAPFAKGYEALYRITFRSGREIVVTKRHVFLTCRGWVSCENLSDDEQMPVFDAYPQESTWAPCLSALPPNAPRSYQTAGDWQDDFSNLFCDAQLLLGEGSGQSSAPSLDDVLAHSQRSSRMGVEGTTDRHSAQLDADRLSSFRYGVRIDQGEMGSFLSLYATKLTCNQFHICAQYRLSPSRQRPVLSDQELRFCIPLDAATKPPFDTVAHIAYERWGTYYDMEVPVHANYVAHGLCSHNTMKTLSTLWAADFIMQKENCRALIVAPLSILQRVWGDAIFANFLGRRTFQIIHGHADQRRDALSIPADFYIINFDGLGVGASTRKRFELDGLAKDIFERADIKLCIVDEASAYRDARTKRHRIARMLVGRRDYLWQLTGTPTSNGPTDAYGLAKLANNAKGESFTSFHNRTMMKVSTFKWIPRAGAYEEARKLLTPAIRFDIRDVWDGPPMTTQQREVNLTDEQKKLMGALKRDLQIVMKSGQPITAMNEGAARQKFIQISLGAVYDSNHVAHPVDASPRVNELKTIIENAPSKILCFAPLTSIVSMLYKELKQKWDCGVVNGEIPQRDRQVLFSRFQQHDDSLRVLIADPGTMAHGLDLYAAQTVIWYGPVDRTELLLQANKRAHRPGQRWPVTVVQIVSNKLEREIYRRLESNESLQGVLLQAVREGAI